MAFRLLVDVAKQLNVELVMTSELIKTPENSSIAKARALLDSNNFDQLPVTRDGKIVGLLLRTGLAEASGKDTIIECYETVNPANSIEHTSSFPALFKKLADRPGCLVIDDDDTPIGLIHISDLDRQPVHYYFYLLISAMEQGLAEMISTYYPKGDWKEWLDDHQLKRLVKTYDRAVQTNAEISYVEVAYFTDLLQVAERSPDLTSELGVTSADVENLRELGKLRNEIMHPVSLLIHGQESVQRLWNLAAFMRRLLRQLDVVLHDSQALRVAHKRS